MKKKIISILSIMILLTGCQKRSNQFTFFENPVCSPPCWENIVPGVTTKQELLERISSLEFVDKSSVYTDENPWEGFQGRVGFSFNNEYKSISFHSYLINDTVAAMVIQGDLNISLDQMIKYVGTPKNILLVHHGDLFVSLFDLDKGFSLGYDTIGRPDWWLSEIRPDIKVNMVIFLAPQYYQTILDARFLSYQQYNSNETLQMSLPWAGFGKIDTLYSGH
jgi:hypothetical protein